MRHRFVITENVSAFVSALGRVKERPAELPGMVLVYGEPGLGKTQTAIWYAARENAAYVRVKKLMTGRWLLEEIVSELGEAPAYRTSDIFRQVVEQLLRQPRVVIVDEVDYLTYDSRVIETLRDVHDITGAPLVLIGMEHADRKLRRYKHLYDRFAERVNFKPLSLQDVKKMAEELLSVGKLTDDAVHYLWTKYKKNVRNIIKALYRVENIAKLSGLGVITRKEIAK